MSTHAFPLPPNTLPPATWQDRFIEKFAETMNVRASALYAGVSRQTVYKYKETDPTFRERYEDAKQDALDILEEAVRVRAVEGVKQITPIYYKGAKIDEVVRVEFSDALAKFYLESHRPEIYRPKQTIEHRGSLEVQVSIEDQRREIATTAIQNCLNQGFPLEVAIKAALDLGMPQTYIALVRGEDLSFPEVKPVIDITPETNGNGSNGKHD